MIIRNSYNNLKILNNKMKNWKISYKIYNNKIAIRNKMIICNKFKNFRNNCKINLIKTKNFNKIYKNSKMKKTKLVRNMRN